MKQGIPRSLPQIIITIVIVAVGASIVYNQLGISAKVKSPTAGQTSQAQPSRAQPSQAQPSRAQPSQAQPSQAQPSAAQGGRPATAKRSIAVRAAIISNGSISNYTKIHGDVVSNNEIKIFPNAGGKLLQRSLSVGDRVSPGTTIALIDPSRVGQTFMPSPVESTVSGTILSMPVHEGDTVSINTVIATVGNLSRIKVSTAVPERYLGNLRIGTPAEIRFDAIPGVVFAARVSEMNPVVDNSSRTLEIKLDLDRTDPRILVGMFATIKLVTESRRNVLVVPRASVILGSDVAQVFVINEDNTVTRRQVDLGLEGEEFFEVKRGLISGDRVVTEGKSSVSEGESVRIVDGAAQGESGAKP